MSKQEENLAFDVQLSIPKGYEIDAENSDLSTGIIKFKEKQKEYPKSVKEIESRSFYIDAHGSIHKLSTKRGFDVNNLSTKERAEAFLALMQLVELRDAYNKIDGFIADWHADTDYKYVITFSEDEICMHTVITMQQVLYFGNMATRHLFYERFKDLIEQAKELL